MVMYREGYLCGIVTEKTEIDDDGGEDGDVDLCGGVWRADSV